jgi:hypothetical protein
MSVLLTWTGQQIGAINLGAVLEPTGIAMTN